MPERSGRVLYFVPALVWALFILVGCLVSPAYVPRVEWNFIGFDKLVHFGLYFIQAAALIFAFRKTGMKRGPLLWRTCILCALYGIAVEFMQMMMRLGRQADVDDALANLAGTFFCCLLYFIFYRSLSRRA